MECCRTVLPVTEEREFPPLRRDLSFDSLVTDAVLAEIKKQSTAGCLLCALEEWAEEDEE